MKNTAKVENKPTIINSPYELNREKDNSFIIPYLT